MSEFFCEDLNQQGLKNLSMGAAAAESYMNRLLAPSLAASTNLESGCISAFGCEQ